MKIQIILLMAVLLLTGCGYKFNSAVSQIENETDSHIFAYTDADVKVTKDATTADDTTLIIVGVKDNTGADITTIFNEAMLRIKEIFHERQKVYKEWLDK